MILSIDAGGYVAMTLSFSLIFSPDAVLTTLLSGRTQRFLKDLQPEILLRTKVMEMDTYDSYSKRAFFFGLSL